MPPNKKFATNRLKKEYLEFKKNPDPSFKAEPLPTNILKWHYVIRGGDETPFAGGYYHGTITFSEKYPYEPPEFRIRTPNGRFSNIKLCLSLISNYHKDWNPTLTVSGMLACFMGVMCEEVNDHNVGIGTMKTTDEIKKKFAYDSLEFNLCDKLFCELFPEIVIEIKAILENRKKSTKEDIENADDRKELEGQAKSEGENESGDALLKVKISACA